MSYRRMSGPHGWISAKKSVASSCQIGRFRFGNRSYPFSESDAMNFQQPFNPLIISSLHFWMDLCVYVENNSVALMFRIAVLNKM
jgi:hypothetical protein